MAILTTGRSEPCSDSIGGIRKVYLFNYVAYANSLIVGVKGSTLTSFPATTIYDFITTNASMSETINNDENGVSYSQSLTFTLKKQDWVTTEDLHTATKGELRYIVELNDGRYKIGGLFNGATISSLVMNSGGSKAEGSNYDVTISGSEEYKSAFISSLSGVGFTVGQWLLTESGDDLLTESSYDIIIE